MALGVNVGASMDVFRGFARRAAGRNPRMIPARVLAWQWRGAAALLVAAMLGAGSAGAQAPDARTLEAGRDLSASFEAGDVAVVWARMNKPMRDALGSEAALADFGKHVIESAGAEGATVSETTAVDGDFRVYRRTAPRAKGGVFVTTWTFAADGAVAGFTITPAAQPAPTAFLDYVTHARLRLPFDGSWYVSWGGRTLADNDHVIARDQRFAYDFVVRNSKSTHRGDGARNEDYFAWDRPIVAPAAGIVVRAVDGVDDNRPAAMNPRQPFGNHVVIDLGNGEFAMLAHLRRGSVAVRAGTRVAAGRVIGRCGNSGNSSEPHLHFHVQNAAREGDVDGLPAQFIHYAADGVDIARGEPVRGQTVRSRWVQP